MAVYYNEFDPFAAEWLRNLMRKGLIPDGEIDTRSIVDVRPDDLAGFTQCHFFAGIAGWSEALRLAGWDPARPVWTGSCPCQPFSVAGRGKGTADERHLWPAFFDLIRECRPAAVFGEQVASKAGREWLSGVFTDLESVGYAGAGADLCAAGIGAPHIRQRLYWVAMADAASARLPQRDGPGTFAARQSYAEPERRSDVCSVADAEGEREPSGSVERQGNGGSGFFVARAEQGCDRFDSGFALHDMADAESLRRRGRAHDEDEGRRELAPSHPCAGSGDMADADSELRDGRSNIGTRGRDEHPDRSRSSDMADADDAGREGRAVHAERPDELSPWSRGVEWRRGADGKERRVKSGSALLVNGISGGVALERTLPSGEKETHVYSRVGALRGLGNAIVPPLAAEFIRAIM